MSAGKLRVHNPLGYPPQITQVSMAPRPSSLDGKTVYLVDCRFDDGDIFLQQMQNWFAQKSGVYTEDDPKLFEEIKQKAAGVIVGVGH